MTQNDLGRTPLAQWLAFLGDPKNGADVTFDESGWTQVEIPHNWDDYHGYHVVSHGNLHGAAWYRTRFSWQPGSGDDRRMYAFFEGVGSYATVFCNGIEVGGHAGGKTTFTLDLTPALRPGENLLAVRADHPEKIADLPFACGGCWGSPNTEGSQPLGIHRPVWLETTGPVRVDPFGVHIVTKSVDHEAAEVEVRTELSNPGEKSRSVKVLTTLLAPDGSVVCTLEQSVKLLPGERKRIRKVAPSIASPKLWGPDHPHLYRAVTEVHADGELSQELDTTFGLRWVEWPPIIPSAKDTPCEEPSGILLENGPKVAEPRIQYRRENIALGVDRGSLVRLQTQDLPHEASLSVDIDLWGEPGAQADLFCEIQDENGTVFFHQLKTRVCFSGKKLQYRWNVPPVHSPKMWTPQDPVLHRVNIELRSPEDDLLLERADMMFGIRQVEGPLNLAPAKTKTPGRNGRAKIENRQKVLKINGEPLFLNGTCEYENLLGCDHAYTEEQIAASVALMMSTGFNAFRDAHTPHNLRYYNHWDRLGVVCWTQMGSHIWFDTQAFRENYKRLVTEWVRERRNNPCVILWGLQNESAMPEDFVLELREIVRELDPSSPRWRLTTTCNGGKGSDWNVPQDWSGTYGGNCHDYDLEARQLVGEYGAWRKFGYHREEETYCGDENDRSETWACFAMETKIRLGETARHKAVGHFHWIFNSFQNPGRTANNLEGIGNAGVGSVNFKGIVTNWHQPTDLYYLYRSNYASPEREPMVYIVSHTWPDRWETPGPRTVHVYSNCDEVELFNGVGVRSFGKRTQPGRGRHFVWKNITPETHLLHAVGKVGDREVAQDLIVVNHLPADQTLGTWLGVLPPCPADPGRPLYRISCGATVEVTDSEGRVWLADSPWNEGSPWGWVSWGNCYDNVPDDVASIGYTMTPVRGTYFPDLYRTYRYGRNYLKYHFKTKPGRYRLRLHMVEPWYGVGGTLDASGMRLFDIGVNGVPVAQNVDVWKEAGGDHRALVREYEVQSTSDVLELHFPKIQVGQAILCGIELFDLEKSTDPNP